MAGAPDPAHRLLRKGLEEEVYAGTVDADPLPLSHRIAADLPGFVKSWNEKYVSPRLVIKETPDSENAVADG